MILKCKDIFLETLEYFKQIKIFPNLELASDSFKIDASLPFGK